MNLWDKLTEITNLPRKEAKRRAFTWLYSDEPDELISTALLSKELRPFILLSLMKDSLDIHERLDRLENYHEM